MFQLKPDRAAILVVDDHEENIQVLASILSGIGLDLIPALNGAQALERLEHNTPDLILLDIVLPDLDGIALCRMIRERDDWKDIPIIFLSVADDKNLIVQALESGGVDYITKPFNQAELLSRVRTHLALKDARDCLVDLATDKDEMLRVLAHDFKNHVAGVQMGASTLLARSEAMKMDERSRRLLTSLQDSSDRMLGFIKTFLANQEQDFQGETNHAIDLRSVLAQVVEEVTVLAQAKDIEIVEPDSSPFWVEGSAEGVRSVFENLLSNAIKFCPSGSKVAIEFSAAGERPRVVVSDTGPGFQPEDLEKIFRRYARLSARPTGGEPSTGLGLFIVQRTMLAMRGEVNVLNQGGAAFELIFQPPQGSAC